MSDIYKRALEMHEHYKGKLNIEVKPPLKSKEDLSLAYSPGVAEPCREIAKDPELSYKYTGRGNLVAVISEGSAVLGLKNIGALAAMPVMEGKSALFKAFAGIDSIPLVINTQDIPEFINIVKNLEPSFGGINLEDIKAPNCFEIEEALIREMNIPVFHDDQHGTAIVALAGLINGLKILGKKKEQVKVVISGAGAAGIAITNILLLYGYKHIVLLDSRGIIYEGRDNLNKYKARMAEVTNREMLKGDLAVATKGADIFLGLSQPRILTKDMVRSMADDPIIFAMSNPDPEIMPEDAYEAGAKIVATGRSDYPNQINNVLAFPGIFRGALDSRAEKITDEMKIAAAEALAALVPNPIPERIIPSPFDKGVSKVVAEEVIRVNDQS
ncbi:NADP-dependent malic enzyme [Patescibacteria group bacterium]